jgi:hypothetical protein
MKIPLPVYNVSWPEIIANAFVKLPHAVIVL